MSKSGEVFAKIIITGTRELNNNKEYINSLNVFPVPDGDTGTNMGLTMESAAKAVQTSKDSSLKAMAKACANGALMGARGNSGVILSQMLRGIANGLEHHEEFTVEALKDAFSGMYKVAYGAVMKPTEGTMLTVARLMGEYAEKNYQSFNSAEDFIEEIIKVGNEALANTEFQLKELEEAGVVDAGGQGIMTILIGALSYHGLKVEELDRSQAPTIPMEYDEDLDIEFGYCTEFQIIGDDRNSEDFKNKIIESGDSIVVVPGDGFIKCHIHTNHPGAVLEEALKIGALNDIKIDNMRFQHQHRHFEEDELEMPKDQEVEFKDFGFVAVSVGEGMNQIFRDLEVDEIIIGGQTMNPSTEDIVQAVKKVPAKDVFIFPNNKNIILSAEQAKIALEDDKRTLHIIPTRSIPEAFTALFDFDTEASAKENLENMTEALEEVKTGQVTFAVRDTEVEGKKIEKGNMIGIDEDHIVAVGKNVNFVAYDLIKELVDPDEDSIITLYYGENLQEKKALDLQERLEKNFKELDIEVLEGGQPLYYYILAIE